MKYPISFSKNSEVMFYQCKECGQRWDFEPGFTTCPHCEEDGIDGDIEGYTMEDEAEARADADLDDERAEE